MERVSTHPLRQEPLGHEGAADEEAEAIAAKRIESGAADHKEDGAEALERLGIVIPLPGFGLDGETFVPVIASLYLLPQRTRGTAHRN